MQDLASIWSSKSLRDRDQTLAREPASISNMKHLHATLFAVACAFVAFTALADPIQIEAVEARLSGEQ